MEICAKVAQLKIHFEERVLSLTRSKPAIAIETCPNRIRIISWTLLVNTRYTVVSTRSSEIQRRTLNATKIASWLVDATNPQVSIKKDVSPDETDDTHRQAGF